MEPYIAILASILLYITPQEHLASLSKFTLGLLNSLNQKLRDRLDGHQKVSNALDNYFLAVKSSLQEEENVNTINLDLDLLKFKTIHTIRIVGRALREEIDRDATFGKEVRKDLKKLTDKLWDENPSLLKIWLESAAHLEPSLQSILEEAKTNWPVNIDAGDYLGRNPYVLSGNIYTNFKERPEAYKEPTESKPIEEPNPSIESGSVDGGTINITIYNQNHENYSLSLVKQIEQIKGKVTQYFTAKTSMDELDEIRQPRPLSAFWLEEVKITLPLVFLDKSFPIKRYHSKPNLELIDQTITAEAYLGNIREIESQLNGNPAEDEDALRDLRSIADDINLKISILNNAFILALYPASSTNDLVENMASKIYYRDLREEAEMHHSVIIKLSNKIRGLMSRFDIDKLEGGINQSKGKVNQHDFDAIRILLDSYSKNGDKGVDDFLNLIKNIDFDRQTASTSLDLENALNVSNEVTRSDSFIEGKRLYILSDESQAAVGMMIDIEQRKILVEGLVQEDRRRRKQTTTWITVSILIIIFLMILGGFFYGPQFTVGQQELNELNLPLINIPWPVIFWSFLGSFAAMIYRFNRQPIHEFGNVLKWTVTRLVQGVILGSAFYLILVSGISLLSGISTDNATDVENSKITTEVVLLLTFLVGFSDRFADSIFNALIDKYSIKSESSTAEDKTHKTM